MSEEIPEKQEGQTWINYFLERMKEKDLDPNLVCWDDKSKIYGSADIGDVTYDFEGKYGLKIQANYTLDCNLHQDRPSVLDDQGHLDRSPKKILGWGDFNQLEYYLGWLSFQIGEDYKDDFFRITLYPEASPIDKDGKPAKNMQVEAEGKPVENIVKKFYVSEEADEDGCDFMTKLVGVEDLICSMVDYIAKENKEEESKE